MFLEELFQTIFLLGSLFAQTKNFDSAKKLLGKAIEIDPYHGDARQSFEVLNDQIAQISEEQAYRQSENVDVDVDVYTTDHIENNY